MILVVSFHVLNGVMCAWHGAEAEIGLVKFYGMLNNGVNLSVE